MISMHVVLQGEGAFADVPREQFIHMGRDAKPIQVVVLDKGMSSGKPSVALRLDLPDGTTVCAETSARLFVTAARAIHARYPDLLED
jgi:hypothetical protein